ncbi:MAG: hypothetical protein A2Y00_00460 [Omnitrophica WOR_2 bacterium GWF2_43_52]|nr:MAG: hypothetical protein A2Y01_07635 [Omnitrophica WOR_2 bacterium GWC2_44_8]OGX20936.1 MAG: hypothetical protein A2Y00_00460 [Omnitrophica WOR_2 bacterium GWF2_43_52]HAH21114.1 hypothetical protein [Candidatus Omnitrophota bacterium]HBG63284.1 hypothetical protein [Candidatus Omnitrophota bacterium]
MTLDSDIALSCLNIGRRSCQGYVFAGTFGLLLRQTSLGVNFRAPPAAESKPRKFPYAPLKHNLATPAGK